jgi:cytochrome c oxidase assembly factor CtaG
MRRALWALAVVAAVTPPFDTYLDASMSRHMLVQMPLLAALGYAAQRIWPVLRLRPPSLPLGAVVFATGTMLFWMLPRSLDSAVALAWVDQLMHGNMLAAGWSLAFALPRLSFHAKMAFGVYALAMLLAAGVVYAMADVPVCATYSMVQQAAAGTSLLWLGGALFIVLLGRGAYLLAGQPTYLNARS